MHPNTDRERSWRLRVRAGGEELGESKSNRDREGRKRVRA